MSNEYELADDSREDLIFTKDQLLAPLLPDMEAPPHPLRLGDTEKDYYAPKSGEARVSPVPGHVGQEGRLHHGENAASGDGLSPGDIS